MYGLPVGAGIPLYDILSEYKFEDNANDTVGSNHGTPTDITYTTALIGKSAVYNGTTSKVVVDNSTGQVSFGSNPFSFSLMVNFATSDNCFLIHSGNANQVEWYVYYRNGEIWFYMESDGDGISNKIYIESIALVPINTDTHIIGTCDGSNSVSGLSLYFDGVLQNVDELVSGTYTGMVNRGGDMYIGAYPIAPNTLDINGKLDVVRFWNKELSAAEALELATKELAGIDINP